MRMQKSKTLMFECLGEIIGTFLLVFFGLGAVHTGVLAHGLSGTWQVAIVFGLTITMAIYTTSALSGTHINPAVTVAFAAYRRFPLGKVPWYILAQLAGAFGAASLLYALFGNILQAFEQAHHIIRGQSGSELSAMVYGCYFPNPELTKTLGWTPQTVTLAQAALAEGAGTALLAFFVFGLTDPRNVNNPGGKLIPLMIGLSISLIIVAVAPLTQSALNPARDFGPRLLAYWKGWGPVAIPGPQGGFFSVYILAPILGALVGGGVYQFMVKPGTALGEAPERREGA